MNDLRRIVTVVAILFVTLVGCTDSAPSTGNPPTTETSSLLTDDQEEKILLTARNVYPHEFHSTEPEYWFDVARRACEALRLGSDADRFAEVVVETGLAEFAGTILEHSIFLRMMIGTACPEPTA